MVVFGAKGADAPVHAGHDLQGSAAGVTPNAVLAKRWLTRAKALGVKAAARELAGIPDCHPAIAKRVRGSTVRFLWPIGQ